jgi:hypothetical protein
MTTDFCLFPSEEKSKSPRTTVEDYKKIRKTIHIRKLRHEVVILGGKKLFVNFLFECDSIDWLQLG